MAVTVMIQNEEIEGSKACESSSKARPAEGEEGKTVIQCWLITGNEKRKCKNGVAQTLSCCCMPRIEAKKQTVFNFTRRCFHPLPLGQACKIKLKKMWGRFFFFFFFQLFAHFQKIPSLFICKWNSKLGNKEKTETLHNSTFYDAFLLFKTPSFPPSKTLVKAI